MFKNPIYYILIAPILLLTSCASLKNFFSVPEEIPPLNIDDKVEAFALATYFIDQHKYDIAEFDYGTGVIKTNYLSLNTGILGTTKLRAKLNFYLTSDNKFDVKFRDIQMFGSEMLSNGQMREGWKSAKYFDTEYTPVRNNILTYLDSLHSDSLLMTKCMDNFLSQFRYNYIVLKTLTEVGRSRFIEQHYLKRKYQWSLPLVDFQYNKNQDHKKKYVALFRYTIGDNEFDKLFSNTIYLNVYTDNDSLANYTKKQLVNYEGVLVKADETFASENYNFEFYTIDNK
jgi:hypothetical protein